MIEPGAVKFLVEHGFDFNKQYSMGIPFYHGPDLVIIILSYKCY